MTSDPDRLADAERELRILTRCTCEPPYPLVSGRHDLNCLTDWREDVDTLANALAAARERITELEAGREIEQTMLRNAAARITELERDLADCQRIAAMLGRKLGGK